jgi:hypothetical protein
MRPPDDLSPYVEIPHPTAADGHVPHLTVEHGYCRGRMFEKYPKSFFRFAQFFF